jgi:hypothetical protein
MSEYTCEPFPGLILKSSVRYIFVKDWQLFGYFYSLPKKLVWLARGSYFYIFEGFWTNLFLS